MNKKYILLTFLLCLSTYGKPQTALTEFAPHGATWTYESIDNGTMPPTHSLYLQTVLDHDTTIAGRTCRIIVASGMTQFYAYRDSLQIWVYLAYAPSSWTMVYDFGWDTGTVVALHNIYNLSDTIPAVVSRKGSIIIGTDTLPVMTLQSAFPAITVIMNLGCINTTFIPLYGSPIVPEYGGTTLRCYQDTVLGTYKAPGVIVCDTDFHVGIPTIPSPNNLLLYPNPAINEVRLLNNNSNITSIEIHSIDGRMLKSISAPTNNISLAGVADGMYVVIVHLRNGEVVTKKLVVQR